MSILQGHHQMTNDLDAFKGIMVAMIVSVVLWGLGLASVLARWP